MKKKISVVLALALALVMVAGLAACGGTNPPATSTPPAVSTPPATGDSTPSPDATPEEPALTTPLNFVFAHPYPASHHHNVGIIEPYIQELMEKIPRLTIELVAGGAISSGSTVHDDVTFGSVDMMWAAQGSAPGRYPLTEMFEFPGHFGSGIEATKVMWDMLDNNEAFRAEYSNFVLFNLYTTEAGEIYSNKLIRTPADLAGVRLRSPSPMGERTMTAAGAVTMNMTMPDVYDNVDRGIVDGLATSPSAIPTYKLQEVVKFATNGMNLYVQPFMMAMSHTAWNQLSPAEQAIVMEVGGRNISYKSAELYDKLGGEAVDFLRDTITVSDLTEDEIAQWMAAMTPVIDTYIAGLEGRNIPARDFYTQMISFRDALR